jgi:hypothetical protein
MAAPVAAPAVTVCPHVPPCPPATAPDHDAAVPVFHDFHIGASRLCNGVLLWEDTGELLPDGSTVAPHRPGVPHCADQSHGHACPCVSEGA